MQGFRKPVGELPPAVYWRRRAVAAMALAVLVVAGWLATTAFAAAGGDDAGSPIPTLTPAASPSPTASLSAAQACGPDDVAITVTADPFTVAADAQPAFAVVVDQVGSAPCVLSADGDDTTLLVTSGTERIWFSGDCAAEAPLVGTEWLLAPGATQEFQVAWPRVRSSEGCASTTAEPKAGYYWAELTVQGITADAVQFELG